MSKDSTLERPASLYDNFRPGGSLHSSGALSVGNLTAVGAERHGGRHYSVAPAPPMDRLKSPSQANCLSTTVPQNIAAPPLSGRHTPTRSSLRHSRMIVLSRTGSVACKYRPPVLRHHRLAQCLVGLQLLVGAAVVTVASWIYMSTPDVAVARKYRPPVLRHHRLAQCLAGLQLLVGAAVITVASWIYMYTPDVAVARKYRPPVLRHHRLAQCLVGLQLLVGAAVVTVASWIYMYTPSLSFRDIPFWSGIPLVLSGLLGLLLLCCCHKDYPGYPLSCCVFSFKVVSVTVSVLAWIGCFCAATFALIHLLSLQRMTCEPADSLTSICVCQTNNTNYVDERLYHDLSCPKVENILTFLLMTSASFNLVGGVLAAWYLYLHWSSRYSYVYSQVRTNEHRPMVISNKL